MRLIRKRLELTQQLDYDPTGRRFRPMGQPVLVTVSMQSYA